MVLLLIFVALSISGTVSAADTNSSVNYEFNDTNIDQINSDNQSSTVVPDPIISGIIMDNSTHKGLSNASVKIRDSTGTIVAQGLTKEDGSYSISFNNSNTLFNVIASKYGYVTMARDIIVARGLDPVDPNFYGTANFQLVAIPYSGNASSTLLNIGALANILLELNVGKSSAWVDTQNMPYSQSEATPLEVKLLTGNLLEGLLNVESTTNQGFVQGGISESNLPDVLKTLGLYVGLLEATANSTIDPTQSSSSSNLASLRLALLNIIEIIRLGAINSNSAVIPDFNTGTLTSTSSCGLIQSISLLGGILEIDAFNVNAIASANGNPGGATASFDWSAADIKLLGISILDRLKVEGSVTLPGVLKISLGTGKEITSADGTHAKASGSALTIELLNLIPGSLLAINLGQVAAEVTVPLGGIGSPKSDLSVIKTVDNPVTNYLQNVVFTLVARNNGPDAESSVSVVDKLPFGLEFVSADGVYDSITGLWNVGNLASGASAVLHITAKVMVSNINLTNIAAIYGGTNLDLNSTNDQSNVTINVGPASDLSIVKIVDDINPKYLQNVVFTLTARNNGPDAESSVSVVDKLPFGLEFVSADGVYDSITGLWNVGNLASGASAVLHIVAKVVVSNVNLTNLAVVSGANYDQNSTNNQNNVTINVGPASDLAISITVDNAHPEYLDYVTFTLNASNNGPDDAVNVKVYNTLPNLLRYVSDDSNGAFNPIYNSTTGLWTVGPLYKGESVILHIVAQAMASNVELTDYVYITDPDPTGNIEFFDPNLSNNYASVSLDVDPVNDLVLTKTVSKINPNYLEKVTFTLKATNIGPDTATNVKVVDIIPAGLKFISTSGNYDSKTGTWNIGNLAKGATAILTIVVQVTTSNTQIVNIANITGNESDLDSTNNKANATINVAAASDLSITKVVNNASPKYLQNVVFTLTARNLGPDTANGVWVVDKLPSGFLFVSADGNYNSNTGVWTIGNLIKNGVAVLHITAKAISPNSKLTNVAVINGTNYDPNSANNKDLVIVNVGPAADLAVKISVSNSKPKYLQKVKFTITAYNHGPMNAKKVYLTIKMPSGLKYVSNDSKGKYNPKTGVWTIGNLKNGGKLVLRIVEKAMKSNVRLTTTAKITGTPIITAIKSTSAIAADPGAAYGSKQSSDSSSTDPDLSNNEASVTVEPYDDSQPVENEADGKDTVAMQPTGIPIVGCILAILLVSVGIVVPKIKK
ncbi:DUF11 domain-containing protein [Methanobacterium alcaliphilum]|uniref:DUF11 domain-containing protein n=1 Tax=Methanobacterium alcaliphilum TaxID=392018 RepID=UPI00200B3D48|nr:DUF11 domain-containing protein [Methanobacterium alcaliphilum]MCK9152547.1 hypothetical protein [Methanobacterium alcaliphilum]